MIYILRENVSPNFFQYIQYIVSLGTIRHKHTPRDTRLPSIRAAGNETVCFPEMETNHVWWCWVLLTIRIWSKRDQMGLLLFFFQMYTSITQESFFLTSGIRTCILSATVGNMSLVRFRTTIPEARFSEYGCQTLFWSLFIKLGISLN